MQTEMAPLSKKALWAGRIMSALPALFLLMDGGMKLVKPAPVVEATVRLGHFESVIPGVGIVLLLCTCSLSDSADVGSWRNSYYGLSWWRCSYSCARPRRVVSHTLPGRVWDIDLGRTMVRDHRFRPLIPLRS